MNDCIFIIVNPETFNLLQLIYISDRKIFIPDISYSLIFLYKVRSEMPSSSAASFSCYCTFQCLFLILSFPFLVVKVLPPPLPTSESF